MELQLWTILQHLRSQFVQQQALLVRESRARPLGWLPCHGSRHLVLHDSLGPKAEYARRDDWLLRAQLK